MLTWFKAPVFDWNIRVSSFSLEPPPQELKAEPTSATCCEEEDAYVLEFSKCQVKAMIEQIVLQTTENCMGKLDEVCDRYDKPIEGLREKLLVAEAQLLDA